MATDESAEAATVSLRRTCDALAHRGPDGHGYWSDPSVGVYLAHRRLAIVDLSAAGDQPMRSRSGRYVLVFNGEIYNFQALRADLEKGGASFSGHSDTEVLLTAIEQWGLHEALKAARGAFALCLYDRQERTFALARDRLGEKPLYYGWIGTRFGFASELTALTMLDRGGGLRSSYASLGSYLNLGYVPAPHTPFESIYKLGPGEVLVADVGKLLRREGFSPVPGPGALVPVKYWDLFDVVSIGKGATVSDEQEAIETLDALLNDMVREQMIADVPLGGFLSGGIDSSVVIALMQHNSTKPVRSFTIAYDDPQFNEGDFARAIAHHLGTEHTEIHVSPEDCLDAIPRALSALDEPVADSSIVPTYAVCREARRHVTVCLSGDGGDELFAGYNRYTFAATARKRAQVLPAAAQRAVGRAIESVPLRYWDGLYGCLSKAVPANRRFRNVGSKLHKLGSLLRQRTFQQQYRGLVSYWPDPRRILTHDFQAFPTPLDMEHAALSEIVEQAAYWDQLTYLPGDNLAKVDRASMAVGLEARLPLLASRVVEFSWRLPLALKLREGRGKWVLREVLRRYVPVELFDRPKMGFSMPVAAWLRSELRDWAESVLEKMDRAVFNVDAIRQKWAAHQTGKHDHSAPIWALLVYQDWHSRAVGGRAVASRNLPGA